MKAQRLADPGNRSVSVDQCLDSVLLLQLRNLLGQAGVTGLEAALQGLPADTKQVRDTVNGQVAAAEAGAKSQPQGLEKRTRWMDAVCREHLRVDETAAID